ncbi:uncharacterized protein EI90DRAFT_3181165 [Cantharellus anzutake]|uniref:uncharacterized protein n=1 Tax=Cantharellus anzutake TaxID=1750568 RepID=UPI001907CC4A|nr:uncharacterized protein EI90DRAFT_3181165 [Cantharellus anzutake]KAF8334236.1 hypothetical protein EI90DRAFT_3181165 [Cantharellus anzutake]
MSGTLRVLRWVVPSRRSYSYFSQKPGGGGRFFTSSKPHKAPPRTTKPQRAPIPSTNVTTPVEAEPSGSAQVPSEHPSSSPVGDSESPATLPASPLSESLPFAPTSHPSPVLPALHLHSFFSQHRPFVLVVPPVELEQESNTAIDAARDGEAFDPMSPIDDPEADTDTARLLARAVVLQRVQAGQEWDSILNRLGIEVESKVIQLDSVKRKRRKKITKHKYKKRRRASAFIPRFQHY